MPAQVDLHLPISFYHELGTDSALLLVPDGRLRVAEELRHDLRPHLHGPGHPAALPKVKLCLPGRLHQQFTRIGMIRTQTEQASSSVSGIRILPPQPNQAKSWFGL